MTYSEKLRDPRWQKKRLQILERDNWACCSCKSTTRNLQVHHLIYTKTDPWNYDDEHLQTLCDECHEIRQRITDNVANRLKLSLANLSIEDMDEYEALFMENTGVGDPLRERIMAGLNDAMDKAVSGESPIHFVLSVELLKAFVFVSCYPSKKNAESLEAAMSMVSEKLSLLIKGGKM